jgi:hypothetical protein
MLCKMKKMKRSVGAKPKHDEEAHTNPVSPSICWCQYEAIKKAMEDGTIPRRKLPKRIVTVELAADCGL